MKWANHYGVNPDLLLRIAKCESTYRPDAVNKGYTAYNAQGVSMGHPMGLFQHVEGYWAGRAATYGIPGASIWDADAQAHVTAGMFRDGQSYMWECK